MASINNLLFFFNSANFMNYPEAGLYFIVVLSVGSDKEGHFNIVFVPPEHSSIKYSTEHGRKTKQDRKPWYNFSWPNWQSPPKVLLFLTNDVSSHSCGAVPYKQHCTSIHNMDSIYVTLSIHLKHCPSSCVQMTEEPPMYLQQYFPSILAKVDEMTQI